MTSPDSQTAPRSPKFLILIAWLFVGVPLAWGVYQTGYQSLGLFRTSSATTPTTTISH